MDMRRVAKESKFSVTGIGFRKRQDGELQEFKVALTRKEISQVDFIVRSRASSSRREDAS